MATTAANVRVGKPLSTGGLLRAPLLTALPTDTTTALNVAFTAQGYVGDGGVTQMLGTSSKDIVSWEGDIVRVVQTTHKLEYKFVLIETSLATLGAYYGDANVSGTSPAFTALIKSGDLPHQAWVIEVRDGSSKIRVCISDGNVTDRGDVLFKNDEAVAYECTITCFPDPTTNAKATILYG